MKLPKGMHPLEKEALDLLQKKFGEDHAGYLLWNETCFPFDPAATLEQAKELVAAGT